MSDNESAYDSKAFAKGCSVHKLHPIRTRLNTQNTNVKTVRSIQTLCKELVYAMQFKNAKERNTWPSRYLLSYNRIGSTAALGNRSLSSGYVTWSAG